MSEKTQTYIVTQTNTLDHAVGDEIELTEAKAACLVNKIRPKDIAVPEVAEEPEKKAEVAEEPEKKAEGDKEPEKKAGK